MKLVASDGNAQMRLGPATPTPQIAFTDVTLDLGGKTIIENLEPRRPTRRIPLHRRRVRLRQDHGAAAGGRALSADRAAR